MIFSLRNMVTMTKSIIERETPERDVNTHKTYVTKRIQLSEGNDTQLKETIYDTIKTIKDPEKPATLEYLNVVREEDVHVMTLEQCSSKLVRVDFTPTVPHCSLATLIGLCIRVKLQRTLTEQVKIDIFVKEGTHSTEQEINKQVNDKERVAAAMENPNLLKIVETCIREDDE